MQHYHRLLEDLRDNHDKKYMELTEDAKNDLEWFIRFLPKFNGKSMMKSGDPTWTILADACPTGGGATDYSKYIAYTFPLRIKETYHISILEALNCLVALRVFLNKDRHHTVVEIKCDNMPAVQVLNSGRAKDKYLAAIVRATWKVIAKADVTLIATHVPGTNMEIPDSLSRYYINDHHKAITHSYISELALTKTYIKDYHFDFVGFI